MKVLSQLILGIKMIGFNNLGKHGRLANQMFQYAALLGISKKYNFEFCIPPSQFENVWSDHQLFKVFKLSSLRNIGYVPDTFPTIQERFYHFDNELFENCKDGCNLNGYFQTQKYFEHISDEVKINFSFHDDIMEPCREVISQENDYIALHVRRTDYVTNSIEHPPLSLDYYRQALELVDPNKTVIVFSDDSSWCKEQDIFKPDKFLISEDNDNATDLCLMTLCSEHIIANSSFSWWGAWLANSQKVIVPINWYGTQGYTSKHNTKDLIPETWVLI